MGCVRCVRWGCWCCGVSMSRVGLFLWCWSWCRRVRWWSGVLRWCCGVHRCGSIHRMRLGLRYGRVCRMRCVAMRQVMFPCVKCCRVVLYFLWCGVLSWSIMAMCCFGRCCCRVSAMCCVPMRVYWSCVFLHCGHWVCVVRVWWQWWQCRWVVFLWYTSGLWHCVQVGFQWHCVQVWCAVYPRRGCSMRVFWFFLWVCCRVCRMCGVSMGWLCGRVMCCVGGLCVCCVVLLCGVRVAYFFFCRLW